MPSSVARKSAGTSTQVSVISSHLWLFNGVFICRARSQPWTTRKVCSQSHAWLRNRVEGRRRTNIFNKVYTILSQLSIYHSASWNIFMSLYHMPHEHYTNKCISQQQSERKEQAAKKEIKQWLEKGDIHNLGPSGIHESGTICQQIKNSLEQRLWKTSTTSTKRPTNA